MAAPKKKKSAPKKAQVNNRSFTLVKEDSKAFFTFRVTQQTAYWLILSLFILGLGVWVMYLTVQVQRIYDQIDSANLTNSYNMMTQKKK